MCAKRIERKQRCAGLVQYIEVSMWGSTSRYESCCVLLRDDTSHGRNGSIRLIGTQILEMLQRDCGIWRLKRFRQILKNLYKYISQRYGCASKIRSPKIQLVSYENSSISASEKGHLTRRTITYPYYYAIHIYIYCLSTCWRCIVLSNHIFVKDLKPQPIAESEFLMVFGSTRPGTVLRGDLQLLKIGPPISVKGEGLQGEWLFGRCHGGEVPG